MIRAIIIQTRIQLPATWFRPQSNIIVSQHCELTLGLYIWRLLQDWKERYAVEVGGSKQSCFYCRVFIDKFNDLAARKKFHDSIIFRGQHNKYVQC